MIERLLPENWTQKRFRYSLLIAFIYSSLCITISVFLFGSNSGLISVFLTSLLILPLMEKLIAKEERLEEKEKTFSLQHLYQDNKEAVLTYLFLFFGIFMTYALYVFIFHLIGINVLESFRGQLLLDFGKGGATFMFKGFWTIFTNNWWVLLTIFLIAFLIKDGGIFFIVWNASSWGVILSYRAITSALYTSGSSLKFFLIVLILSFPFMLLEALAYIMAAIAGNIISKDVVKKTAYIKQVTVYLTGSILIYAILHYLTGLLSISWLQTILQILVVLIFLYFLGRTIQEPRHHEVFVYNYYLFIIGLVFFFLGALLEVLITSNVDILTKIYSTSMLFTLVP
jgi:hypothetical protein